jgi:hypothetical protein
LPILTTQLCGSQFDSLENFHVTSAPADIAAKRTTNGLAIRVWVFPQQRARRQHESRTAVTTLGGSQIRKCILQRVQGWAIRQALDGIYLFTNNSLCQGQTRQHRLAIYQNRASPTLAQLTAMRCARQTHVFAQDFKQGMVWRERHLVTLTVHIKNG